MEKRKSAIEKIVLNAPTYNNVVCEPTFINFFFGRNGAGKSTVAKALEADAGIQWRMGQTANDYNVLVYDQDFINSNFDNYEMAGVFTLNKVNIEVQKKIDAMRKEKDDIVRDIAQLTQDMEDKRRGREELQADSQDRMMKLADATKKKFELAMVGKKVKKTFCPEIEKYTPIEHKESEIEELYAVAYDKNAKAYDMLKKSSDIAGRYDLSGMELLDTAIISTSNTQFAKVMEKIGNTDWVKEGHAKYVKKADGICPFCHKKLEHDFEDEIKKCFDEQYQNDVNAVAAFQTAYDGKTKEILRIFDNNLLSDFPRAEFSIYKMKLEEFRTIVQSNLVEIQKKVDKPAIIVKIKGIDTVVAELDTIVDEINKQIKQNNDGVAAKKDTKIKCDRMLWEYLAFLVKDEKEDYKRKDAVLADAQKRIETEKTKKHQQLLDKETEIKAEGGKTVNTDEAFESINAMLLDSGFQGFSLRKKPGTDNRYEVVRDGGMPVKKLSEGERNFIAFLYFYHLVRGNGKADTAIIRTDGNIQNVTDTRDKIVVIDDPVSSMDSSTMFIVSSMVREMISVCHNNIELLNPDITGSYIKQIFILTHNAYFHREITYNQVDFYDCVSFFMIRKNDNHSSITLCADKAKELSQDDKNVNPVQNAYTALWTEYKELQSSIPLLNVIRRILEYYFMELCGYQGQGIRDTILKKHKTDFITKRPDGTIDDNDYHLAYSMLSYIDNDCSFIDGFNLVHEAATPEQYRKVMKKIFEKMGQSQHYKMMYGE